MRYRATPISLVVLAVSLTGCGTREARRVPDVRGDRLDVAEQQLGDRGLDFEEVGGGAFGIVVRSNWRVCDQDPRAGRTARSVRLIVDRDCEPPPVVPTVPDVIGENLDEAEEDLDAAGVGYSVEAGDEEPIVEHLWEVCGETPAPGTRTDFVELYVARDCD
jgi:beta-lactam-binding protein with PASTA domain